MLIIFQKRRARPLNAYRLARHVKTAKKAPPTIRSMSIAPWKEVVLSCRKTSPEQ